VNEAAITGQSAPVIRESRGDLSAVTGNNRLVSDWLLVRISTNPRQSTLVRKITLVEGAKSHKPPNEEAQDNQHIVLTRNFMQDDISIQPYAQLYRPTQP
ncbi:potassium-transporting ATPase subunit B, partial [Pseudomonas syringae pv. tagetis]